MSNNWVSFYCMIDHVVIFVWYYIMLQVTLVMTSKGPGLYEFLIEAELQQYYAGLKNDLKVSCKYLYYFLIIF